MYKCIIFSNPFKVSKKKHKTRKIYTYHRNLNGERSYSYGNDDIIPSKSKINRSHHLFIGSMRIAFGFLIILIIILCLISGIFYGLDLIIQNSCKLAHNNQSFVISSITGN